MCDCTGRTYQALNNKEVKIKISQPEDKGIVLKDILEDGVSDDYNPDLKTEQRLEPRLDEKSGTLTTVQKDNVLITPEVLCGAWRGRSFDKDGNPTDWKSGEHKQVLETREDGKTNSITSVQKDNVVVTHPTYRKLTPVECMRLQTVDDDYFDDTGISNTQKYKLLGNGWTIDVIVHLLQGLKAEFIKQRIAA